MNSQNSNAQLEKAFIQWRGEESRRSNHHYKNVIWECKRTNTRSRNIISSRIVIIRIKGERYSLFR